MPPVAPVITHVRPDKFADAFIAAQSSRLQVASQPEITPSGWT
jgi:hypothetical protein